MNVPPSPSNPPRPRLRDARGAVFVEKLIVYLPLLLTFFVTWELAELTAAKLVVERACSAAGRAAMVVLPDDPAFYDAAPVGTYEGQRRGDIELAAGMVLSSIPRLRADFEVDVSEPPEGVGPIDVSITAPYDCGVVSVICGTDDSIELSASSTHIYHGAKYAYSLPAGGPDVGGTGQALSEGGDDTGGGDETGDGDSRYRAKPGRPPPPPRTGSGCPALENLKTTTFYRSMSAEHAAELARTGRLPGTKETCISPTLGFSLDYEGVLVKFTVKTSTISDLAASGFKHTSAWIKMKCPCLEPMKKGWVSEGAAFKTEGPQLNLCLGNGKGLDKFNDNIVSFEVVDKESQASKDQAAKEKLEKEADAIKQQAEIADWKKKTKSLRQDCDNNNTAACKELGELLCEDVQPKCQ